MARTTEDDSTARWYTVSDDAARTTVEATIKAALLAQRDRLDRLYVDIASDRAWPADVHTAVRLAENHLAANPRDDISLTLDPRVDGDFEIALALAPFSIGCTGIGLDGALIWDANDTGASAAFALTPTEKLAVRAAIADAGGSPGDLTGLLEYHLRQRALSYDIVGGTAPAADRWRPPGGWRAYEHTVPIGAGPELWDAASSAVLSWGVKTRSGFAVDPPLEAGRRARQGERYWLVARLGPVRVVREPVEIVTMISTHDRAALAYGTLEGHPVSGEEAFIVRRDDDGNVSLTLRSLTRAGQGPWRGLFPLILIAQRVYRRRHLRALQRDGR